MSAPEWSRAVRLDMLPEPVMLRVFDNDLKVHAIVITDHTLRGAVSFEHFLCIHSDFRFRVFAFAFLVFDSFAVSILCHDYLLLR